jgi:hypothetical protein
VNTNFIVLITKTSKGISINKLIKWSNWFSRLD